MRPKLILGLLCAYVSFAQTEYYTTNEQILFNQATLEEMARELQDNYTASYGSAMYTGVSILKTRVSGDSIINTVQFDISAKAPSQLITRQGLAKLVGSPLPLGILKKASGEDFMIKDLLGKPSLITFWSTRNADCAEELPVLNQLKKQYGDKVNFVAISHQTAEMISDFLSRKAFNFTHIAGAESFMDTLGINDFPTTLFLDSQGIIRAVENGVPHHVNFQTGEMTLGNGKEFIAVLESLQ